MREKMNNAKLDLHIMRTRSLAFPRRTHLCVGLMSLRAPKSFSDVLIVITSNWTLFTCAIRAMRRAFCARRWINDTCAFPKRRAKISYRTHHDSIYLHPRHNLASLNFIKNYLNKLMMVVCAIDKRVIKLNTSFLTSSLCKMLIIKILPLFKDIYIFSIKLRVALFN